MSSTEDDTGVPDLWGAGDYPAMARRLAPAAELIAAVAGNGRGRFALDIAAGTGSVALRLADAGWQVLATDGSPRMVELGRAETDLDVQDVRWERADLSAQPCGDSTQDVATSSFGLIFATDPRQVLTELARVLTPAGHLLFTTWTDDGYIAQMTEVMTEFMPAPAASAPDPMSWGSASRLRQLLAERFLDVEISAHPLPWSFPSAKAGRAWLERASPAHIAAKSAVGDQARGDDGRRRGAPRRLRAAVRSSRDRRGVPTGASPARALTTCPAHVVAGPQEHGPDQAAWAQVAHEQSLQTQELHGSPPQCSHAQTLWLQVGQVQPSQVHTAQLSEQSGHEHCTHSS